jgi:hypothetical protein
MIQIIGIIVQSFFILYIKDINRNEIFLLKGDAFVTINLCIQRLSEIRYMSLHLPHVYCQW